MYQWFYSFQFQRFNTSIFDAISLLKLEPFSTLFFMILRRIDETPKILTKCLLGGNSRQSRVFKEITKLSVPPSLCEDGTMKDFYT